MWTGSSLLYGYIEWIFNSVWNFNGNKLEHESPKNYCCKLWKYLPYDENGKCLIWSVLNVYLVLFAPIIFFSCRISIASAITNLPKSNFSVTRTQTPMPKLFYCEPTCIFDYRSKTRIRNTEHRNAKTPKTKILTAKPFNSNTPNFEIPNTKLSKTKRGNVKTPN